MIDRFLCSVLACLTLILSPASFGYCQQSEHPHVHLDFHLESDHEDRDHDADTFQLSEDCGLPIRLVSDLDVEPANADVTFSEHLLPYLRFKFDQIGLLDAPDRWPPSCPLYLQHCQLLN